MKITRKSGFTGIERTREIPVTPEQMKAWQDGELIQNAMPNISAGDREFIMTGITEDEWDECMKKDEEALNEMRSRRPK